MANESAVQKVPPQSNEAEMALLGSMLIEKEAVIKAIDIVGESDFYNEAHRQIFINIVELFNENKAADIVTISDKLNKNGLFAELGGAFYLTSLIDSVQTAANVEQYAEIVRDKSVLRQLFKAGSDIAADSINERYPPEEILDKSQSLFLAISKSKNNEGFEKLAGKDPQNELASATLKLLAKLHESKNEVPGLRTGFIDLDSLTAGLQPSELIIIAARPGMGKTTFALNIAEHVAIKDKQRKAVGIFSVEMSKEELIKRFLASIARIDGLALKKGLFKKDDWMKLTNAMEIIRNAPIFVDDRAFKIGEIRSRARKLELELRPTQTPLGLIVIDYIQLLEGTGKFRENRVLDLAEVSKALKILAKDLKIPIVVLSQLNRTSEKSRKGDEPLLSDLRDSGAIEQDADVVAFIHREGYYERSDPDKEKLAKIIIAKQRNGPTGKIDLTYEGKFTRFENAAFHPG